MDEAQSSYVVFVWTPSGYELLERQGDLPPIGTELEDDGRTLVVTKVAQSPLPGDTRRCAYLQGARIPAG